MLRSSLPSSDGVRRRFAWALLVSVLLNVPVWLLNPHLFFERSARTRAIVVATIHIDRRRRRNTPKKPKSRSIAATPAPKPIATATPVAAKTPAPRPAAPRKRVVPQKRSVAHVQPKLRPRIRLSQDGLSYVTHSAAALQLPRNWGKQDLANGAAANATIWVDFKKARGAFVPKVFLLHLNTAFMSGPTLQDAVHDIVANLRSENAKIYVSKAQPLCSGTQPGWFLSYRKPQDDPPAQFEETLFVQGETVYRAVYSRPDGQVASASTRAALDTICPMP